MPARWQAPARRLAGHDLPPEWLNAAWFAERGVHPRAPLNGRHGLSLQDELLAALHTTSLPGLLRYEDRNSMAVSIESRVPFLTPALASFVLSLPEEYLIAPDGTSKAVFRLAMRGIVPDALLERRDTVGPETSERAWLPGLRMWGKSTLSGERARRIPALNLAGVQRAWNARLPGERNGARWIRRCGAVSI